MFFTISLVIFWILFILCLAGTIYSGEAESILLMVVFGLPGLAFVTFATVFGGWVMPVIVCWISVIAIIGLIAN